MSVNNPIFEWYNHIQVKRYQEGICNLSSEMLLKEYEELLSYYDHNGIDQERLLVFKIAVREELVKRLRGESNDNRIYRHARGW